MALRWLADQPAIPPAKLALRALALLAAPVALGILNGLRFTSGGLQPFVVGTGVAFTFAVGAIPVVLGLFKPSVGRSP